MAALNLFPGELVIVTGSASNIGRGIALALAREGADVVLADIDGARNDAVAAEISALGRSAIAVTCDLATADGWRSVLDALGSRTPEMFVHSACPRRNESDVAATVDEATFDAMLNTNVRSGFFLGRELALRMRDASVPGRLLYITSLHAESPRNLPHYSASKAGMTMIVRELARAFGPAGIRVNALAPGAIPGGGAAIINDGFGAKDKIPLQRLGSADDLGAAAVAMMSNRFMGYVTGATLPVDGGLAGFNWIAMPSGGEV